MTQITVSIYRPSWLQPVSQTLRMYVWACYPAPKLLGGECLWLGFAGGKYLMRSTLPVSIFTYADFTVAICWGFDLGDGRVYRGLSIAGESGRQRLRVVTREGV